MTNNYLKMRRRAMVLADNGGYDLSKAEMNPVIFEELIGAVADRNLLSVIWEPFAGKTSGRFSDAAEMADIKPICHWLMKEHDDRLLRADSTREGPGEPIGAVLFHPPYFGSHPLSSSECDIALIKDEEEYRKALQKVSDLARKCLVQGGLVCSIGRDYRVDGKRIRLDEWYLDIFGDMKLVEVWSSTPDMALIFEVSA